MLDQRGARPAGVPAQHRPPRRLGQHPRPRGRRASPRTPRTRPTAGSSATPTATPPARCARRPSRSSATTSRPRREEYADAMREAQSHLHSWGITGWHDALIGGYAGLDDPTQAYLDLIDAGELTARVRCSQWWDRSRGARAGRRAASPQRDLLPARGLDAGSVKVMMDGIAETFTATLSEPYVDLHGCPCGDHGPAVPHRRAGRRGGHRPRRGRAAGALPRHRRQGRARRAGRRRGGAPHATGMQRPAPPDGAPAAGAARGPAPLRRPRGGRQPAGHVGAAGTPRP